MKSNANAFWCIFLFCLGGGLLSTATAQTSAQTNAETHRQTHAQADDTPCQGQVLSQTQQGRAVVQKPLPFFKSPTQHMQRWQAINHYFAHRFGIDDVLNTPFRPRAVVLHSTESENEASVYRIFARDQSPYLGGVWTTFAVDRDGTIVQYSPLNRLSKGQAGVNDLAVGIEIVGHASRYQGERRLRAGSIARRYEHQQRAQIEAVIDLTQTLQRCFEIPTTRVFSHTEVASIQRRSGQSPVDYNWLKGNIRDAVYLGQKPLLNGAGHPVQTYAYLEPYGRSDPGLDVMQTVRSALTP